jgi:hypothetical protein
MDNNESQRQNLIQHTLNQQGLLMTAIMLDGFYSLLLNQWMQISITDREGLFAFPTSNRWIICLTFNLS